MSNITIVINGNVENQVNFTIVININWCNIE